MRRSSKSPRSYNTVQMNPVRMPVLNIVRTLTRTFDMANPSNGAVYYSNTDSTANGFQLNQLPGYTEFTNLYDQYRIVGVDIRWTPSVTQAIAGATPDQQLPRLVTVADFNDGTVPTTLSNLTQYQSFRADLFNKTLFRSVKPRTALAVYNNLTNNGYALQDGPTWVDTGSAGVQHYGIKWGLVWPVVGTGISMGKFTVDFTFKIQLRCVN